MNLIRLLIEKIVCGFILFIFLFSLYLEYSYTQNYSLDEFDDLEMENLNRYSNKKLYNDICFFLFYHIPTHDKDTELHHLAPYPKRGPYNDGHTNLLGLLVFQTRPEKKQLAHS